MKILLIRQGDSFKPLSEADYEKTQRVKEGRIIEVDYKMPRNPEFHNKYMSMVRAVFDNQEQYETIEQVLDVIKVGVGHCTTMEWRGAQIAIPKSISFGKMDELEFQPFYDKSIEFVLARLLPGTNRDDLEQYVNEISRYAG